MFVCLFVMIGKERSNRTLESAHPYLDNQDIYEKIEIPDAIELQITFDNKSMTEANYDYVKFYSTDSRDVQYGELMYSGGRNGSTRNFPGTDGRIALTIPGNKFEFHFHSDGKCYVLSINLLYLCVIFNVIFVFIVCNVYNYCSFR